MTAPTRSIVCNAVELEISNATLELARWLVRAGRSRASPSTRTLERVTFTAPAPVPAGPCVLECDFAGVLNDKLRGFYRSTFRDEEGVERVIATTQFESTDARRAFPCWDEPDRKAVFSVTLEVERRTCSRSRTVPSAPRRAARRQASRSSSPTPSRCRPTSSPSSSARSRSPTPWTWTVSRSASSTPPARRT